MLIILALYVVSLSLAVKSDRCDTDLHPKYGVKGTCMEKKDCLDQGGFYEDNWCMSEKPSIKCCFFKKSGKINLIHILILLAY
jgi:hypothetical protein